MREHLFEIYFDEMTMSILINMDEMLHSASSYNVILERKNAKQLWQQERKQEKNNKKKQQFMLDYCLLQM